MEIHLLHKDFANLVSCYPRSWDDETICKSIRYFFLGILKRLPEIEDFKTTTKYKPLQTIENKQKVDCVLYNLDEVSLGDVTVSARTVGEAKRIAIHQFVTKRLKLQFDSDNDLSVFENAQQFGGYPKFNFFIYCPEWEPLSIVQMQREYYSQRTHLGVSDFLMVGSRKCVDAAICTHIVNENSIHFPTIVANHVTQCLNKQMDDGQQRAKLIQSLYDTEKKASEYGAISWPRTGTVPNNESKEEYRKRFRDQHPYFSSVTYKSMAFEVSGTKEYPVISEKGIQRLPDDVEKFYQIYSNPTFLGNCGGVDMKKINQWVSKRISQYFSIWKQNDYDTVDFSCFSLCSLQEALKICGDIPSPKCLSMTKDKKDYFWKVSQSCKGGVIVPEVNIYDLLEQKKLNCGLIILSHMRLWHIFPPPKPARKSNGGGRGGKKKSTSKMADVTEPGQEREIKRTAAEYDKSFYVLTVGFPEVLYQSFNSIDKFKRNDWKEGLPPEFSRILGEKKQEKKETYQRYLYYRHLCTLPCSKHLILKTLESIHLFIQHLNTISGIPVEMLFDTSLAEHAFMNEAIQ